MRACKNQAVRSSACLIWIVMACAIAKGQANTTAGLAWLPPSDTLLELDGFVSPPKTTVMRNGSRLRLRSDSPTVAVRYSILSPLGNHVNMHLYGRTSRRNYPPRVFGFPDSDTRETPAEDPPRVGHSLQPRPSSLQPGPRYSGTLRTSGATKFRSQYSVWSSSDKRLRSGRFASRLSTRRNGSITGGRKLRRMRFFAEHKRR